MDFLFPSAEYCIVYILAIATLQGPLSWPCLALPCLALPCLALPCLALPCLALPCLALPCLALPCLALPCLALPCLALPCLALPCLALPGPFSGVLIPARVPGLSLCLALLDVVRRSSTHTCPRITFCLARVVPVCHWTNLACFVTTPMNKSLHMDPHVSRLVRPVTDWQYWWYFPFY